jgi:hypothetical protein
LNTDRRTRDRVRLFFWAVLFVVCVAAVSVARQQQQQGLDRKGEAAQERAVRYTDNALVDRIDADRASRPFEGAGYDSLLTDVRRDLFTDQRVVRVRIWGVDGLLVFTTDDPEEIGNLTSTEESLRAGLKGEISSVITTETLAPDLSTTPTRTELLATYVPMRTSDKDRVYAVVEIDNDYGLLREGTSRPWYQMQIAFGIVAILCLVMTVLSFIWSRRSQEVTGFGPNRRDARAVARDDRKVAEAKAEVEAAKAEAATLRTRVKELEHRPEQPAVPEVDPAELQRVTARAAHLEEQSRAAEGRTTQLQARVTELEAQLRLTTDQLRAAAKRVEESQGVPAEFQAKLEAVEANERRLSTELQLAREEVERAEKARALAEKDRAALEQMKQGELDQIRAQVRMAEEERQQILAEAAKSPTAEPVFSEDAQTRIEQLEEALQRSETERGMLRSGRPETVYEVRNRELEEGLAQVREQLAVAEERARTADASRAGVDPGVIAALEERIGAAEERAREAERLLEQAKGRRGSRSTASTRNGTDNGNGTDPAPAPSSDEAPAPEEEAPPVVDGSELRSRLVRSTDARRRGVSKTSDQR